MINMQFYNDVDERLHDYIDHYWLVKGPGSITQSRLLPMGHVDMILNVGDQFKYHINGSINTPLNIHYHGIRSRTVTMSDGQDVHALGITFKPWGFYFIIRQHMSEVANRIISPIDLNKELDLALKTYTIDEDFASVIQFIESILLEKIYITDRELSECRIAKGFITSTLSVKEYCLSISISTKRLERIFNKYIGLPPKKYRDLNRVEDVLRDMISHGVTHDLTKLATEYMYYDQSHFIRDIKSYIGDSPRNFNNKNDTTKASLNYVEDITI